MYIGAWQEFQLSRRSSTGRKLDVPALVQEVKGLSNLEKEVLLKLLASEDSPPSSLSRPTALNLPTLRVHEPRTIFSSAILSSRSENNEVFREGRGRNEARKGPVSIPSLHSHRESFQGARESRKHEASSDTLPPLSPLHSRPLEEKKKIAPTVIPRKREEKKREKIDRKLTGEQQQRLRLELLRREREQRQQRLPISSGRLQRHKRREDLVRSKFYGQKGGEKKREEKTRKEMREERMALWHQSFSREQNSSSGDKASMEDKFMAQEDSQELRSKKNSNKNSKLPPITLPRERKTEERQVEVSIDEVLGKYFSEDEVALLGSQG